MSEPGVDTRSGAGDQRAADPPGLDLGRLRSYLDRVAPGLTAGPLRAELFVGGRSNLTYAVSDGARTWVLRRPPLGHVLPTAHDMAREHRVLAALAGNGFPAPRPVLLCTDPDVIGAPFYLMQHVDGTILRDAQELERLGTDGMRALTLSLVETLADLHALVPAEIGLADFGRPEGFNGRQVHRWKKQLDASHSRDLPGIAELYARLATQVPDGPPGTVVHGDFRLDNILVGPAADSGPAGSGGPAGFSGPAGSGGPAGGTAGLSVRAVLDWEMSTLGDPLSDLALMIVYARQPLLSSATGPRAPLSVPGHPGIDELAAHYALRSGRDVGDLHWYVGFAAFKLAVILEGVHYRYVKGQTVGRGFDTVGAMVPMLVAQGHEALEVG